MVCTLSKETCHFGNGPACFGRAAEAAKIRYNRSRRPAKSACLAHDQVKWNPVNGPVARQN